MIKLTPTRIRLAQRVLALTLSGAALFAAAGCSGDEAITTTPGAQQSGPTRDCTNGRDKYSTRLNPSSLAQLKQVSTLVVVGTVTTQEVRSGIIKADTTPPQTIAPPNIPAGSLPPGVIWTPPERTMKDLPTEATLSYYESRIQVREVLGGDLAGKNTIVLRSPGDGSTTNCEPEDLAPVQGQEYLFFLRPSPPAPFEKSAPTDTYWVTGGSPSGRFFVLPGRTIGRDKGTPNSPQSGASVEVAAMSLDQLRDAVK